MMKKLKNSILILLTLISVVNGIQDTFSEEELKQLEKALKESSKYMTKEVQDEDVIICIGATRAGKSTLINYMIDNKLKAERDANFQPITISKVDSKSLGPEIGIGSTSKTTIPTRWTSKNFPEMAIWDAPGFDDNRGPVQDITNAFYLYQLMQKVKSLKIVLVVDINDILHDNIKPFITVLKAVEGLLGKGMKSYFTSISIIFTKVPDSLDDIPVDMQYINEKLTYQFLSSGDMNLSPILRDIVQFLIRNNNHIAFFKRPQAGPVTSAIDVNIFPVIKSSTRISKYNLKEISPSVSDTSKLCLFKARDTLFSVRTFQELQDIVSVAFDKKVNDFFAINNPQVSENKIKEILTDLRNIETRLDNTLLHANSFPEKLEILQTIDYVIKKKVEEENVLEKYQLIEFIDKLLDLKESNRLDLGLQGVLRSSSSKVKECLVSAQTKLNEIIQRKYEIQRMEEQRRRQEEIDKLNAQLEQQNRERNKKKGFWRRLGNLFG